MSHLRSLGHRRRVVIAAAATVAATSMLLAGCSSAATPGASASAGGNVTVTLWESQANEPVKSAMDAIVQHFQAANPNITVQLHLIGQGSQVLSAIQAGNPPIMGEVNHYIAQQRSTGQLKEISSMLTGAGGMTASDISQMYPSVWDDGNIGNNQHYRLLVDTKVSTLLYNKAIFQQAGIASTPTTYAELQTDLGIIQQKVPGVTPMAIDQSIGDIFPPFLANGGSLYAAGSTTQTDWQSTAAKDTFTYFQNLFANKQLIFQNTTGGRALFAQGKLAVLDQTSAGSLPTVQAVNNSFQVGAFAWPNGTSGHGGNVLQGEGVIMMAGYSQAEYDAAAKFLAFWMSPKEQAYWAVHSGYAPETKAATQYITAADFAANPALQVAIDALNSPNTIHRPAADAYSQVESKVTAAFFNAVSNNAPVDQTLADLQQQSNQILASSATATPAG